MSSVDRAETLSWVFAVTTFFEVDPGADLVDDSLDQAPGVSPDTGRDRLFGGRAETVSTRWTSPVATSFSLEGRTATSAGPIGWIALSVVDWRPPAERSFAANRPDVGRFFCVRPDPLPGWTPALVNPQVRWGPGSLAHVLRAARSSAGRA